MAGISLAGLKIQEGGARCVLRHPVTGLDLVDGEGKAAVVVLRSQESREVRAADDRASAQNQEYAARHRGKLPPPSVQREQGTERLIAATIAIENLSFEDGGEPIQATAQELRQLYGDPALSFIREQVVEFLLDRANFLPASKPS